MEQGSVMKKWGVPLILALVVAATALALLTGRQPAPQVEFTLLSGDKLRLANLRGKVVLVNFWATSCPGCIHEMPSLVATYEKYHDKGLETVAVAMSYDPPDYVRTFAAKQGLPFEVALDGNGAAAAAFGNVRLTPTTFVISRDGFILQRYTGEPDFNQLQQQLEKAL
jgi:peroxiredoxin